jgi:hypothetical protein
MASPYDQDVSLRRAATLCMAALVVGCGDGEGTLKASLDDVDPSGGYWAIRATCDDGRVRVEFDPGDRLSVPGLGRASSEEIAVECGEAERVTVSDQELRRRTATPTGADLAVPASEPTELTCLTDGSLLVEAHPVWAQNAVVGGALHIEDGGDTIVDGVITTEESGFPSELRWWRARCAPS